MVVTNCALQNSSDLKPKLPALYYSIATDRICLSVAAAESSCLLQAYVDVLPAFLI